MLAGVDTTFYIWIITSINNIMITLAARKQATKYVLYRNFRFILFVSLFATFTWILYSSVITVNNGKGDLSNWKYKWTIDGKLKNYIYTCFSTNNYALLDYCTTLYHYNIILKIFIHYSLLIFTLTFFYIAMWEFIYFILFLIICILWSPHKNNQRYAYSYDTENLENDEEWQNANKSLIAEEDDVGNNNNDNNGVGTGNNNNGVGNGTQSSDNNDIKTASSTTTKNGIKTEIKRKSLLDDSDDEDELFHRGGALDSKIAILKKN